jgi:predicted transcriptional regulator
MPISGQNLLADFQTAFIAVATADAAKFEAERSEQEVISHLSLGNEGSYLDPKLLSDANQFDYKRASLDAHIKKVQAEQVGRLSQQQIAELIEGTRKRYRKKRARITIENLAQHPVEAVWFDQKYGQRNNVVKGKKTVVGTIETVLLDKNALILRPGLMSRLLMPSLKYYVVYVIDPDTLQPMISCDLA